MNYTPCLTVADTVADAADMLTKGVKAKKLGPYKISIGLLQ